MWPEIKNKKLAELSIILFIFIIALVFRIKTATSQGWLADEIPYLAKGEWFSIHIWEYIFQIKHALYPPSGKYFVNPPFSMWLMAIGIYIARKLGTDLLFGARMVNVIFGSMTCVLIYLFGKKFYNRKVGIFAGIILALSPTYIAINASAYLETISSFFVLLGLYLFFSFLDDRNKRYLYSLAIVFGISIITKFLVIPIAGLTIIYLFYLLVINKSVKNKNNDNIDEDDRYKDRNLHMFIIFLIIFVATPLILWAGARDIDSIVGVINYVQSMMTGNYTKMFDDYSGLTVGENSKGLYFYLMIFGTTLPIIGLAFPIAVLSFFIKWLNLVRQKKNIGSSLSKQLFMIVVIIVSIIFVNYFGLIKTTTHKMIFIIPIIIIFTIGWLLQNIDVLLNKLDFRHRETPILSIILLISILPTLMWSPEFYYAYNNFLVGGVRGASHLYRVGDGEGLELVGKWLNNNTNTNEKITILRFGTLLKKYTNRSIIGQPLNKDIDDSLHNGASYLVVHNSHVSGQLQPDINFNELRAEFTVYVDNYPYINVYNLKEYPYRKFSTPIDIDSYSWNIYSKDIENKISLSTNSPRLKIDYKINKGWVAINKSIANFPVSDGIGIEMLGDKRKSNFRLELYDSNKNARMFTTSKIDWSGWRRFYFSFNKMKHKNGKLNISDIDTLSIIIYSDKIVEGNIYIRNISIIKKN